MYTIIGGDGKEYGPVPADQVRAWISAGRANLDTRAKAVGTAEWKRVGDLPEFAEGPPELQPRSQPGDAPSTPLDAELAGRWIRLGARLLDGVVFCTLLGPGLVLLIPWLVAHANDDPSQGLFSHTPFSPMASESFFAGMPPTAATLLGIGWIVYVTIKISLLTLRGQTIGKWVAGIRIVRLDGQRVGFVRAWLLRDFVVGLISAVPVVGPVFALIDLIFIFSESRRCLHDRIAGTVVVKV
jgi:uncharacterized RDD family membrane protein YckC